MRVLRPLALLALPVALVGCSGASPSAGPSASQTPTAPATPGVLDVTVGPQDLPGTLRVPTTGAKPVVALLLPGSGPQDRDETIGKADNKPLRDIAEGLAAQGIASLRFDKRTKAAASSFTKDSTIADEYLDDAAAAIRLLAERPETAKDKVFVVGHSQGAMVMPTIVQGNPSVAGGVSLAGSPRSLFDIMYDQNVALVAKTDLDAKQKQQTLAGVRHIMDQAKAVRSATDPMPESLAASMPSAYVASLNALDPVADARASNKPLLFLQGEKDAQVSVGTDLAAWRSALAGRPATTFTSYPGLNHLFMPTTGRPAPADYDEKNRVDAKVIGDLATWLAKN